MTRGLIRLIFLILFYNSKNFFCRDMARMNGIQDVAKTSPDPSRVLWVILATNKPVFKILFFSLFLFKKREPSKGSDRILSRGSPESNQTLSLSFHFFILSLSTGWPWSLPWHAVGHTRKRRMIPFPVSIDPTSFTLPFLRPSSMLVVRIPPPSRRKGATGVLIGQAFFFFINSFPLPFPLSLFFSTVVNRHSPSSLHRTQWESEFERLMAWTPLSPWR